MSRDRNVRDRSAEAARAWLSPMLLAIIGALALGACDGSEPDASQLRGLGEACGRNDQCAPNSAGPVVCACGRRGSLATCQLGGALGGACETLAAQACEVGAICDDTTRRCVSLPSSGESCDGPCEAGLVCRASQCAPMTPGSNGEACKDFGDCASLHCLEKKCAPPSPEGQPCAGDSPKPCAEGLACSYEAVCSPLRPDGATCPDGVGRLCASHHCFRGYCTPAPSDAHLCADP